MMAEWLRKETTGMSGADQPKRAVIYARFSPRRHDEESESIETQIELCREYCAKRGYTIVGELEDRAMSGGDAERPGLWAAIESLSRGMTLVVYKLDRLARDVYLSHIIERKVLKRKAFIESSCGEGTWDDTPESRLVRQVLASLAEYERIVSNARTKASMLRHQRNGRRMSDRVPFGWSRDPGDDKRIVKNEHEQAAIKQICELKMRVSEPAKLHVS